MSERYEVRVQGPARRAVDERLPEEVTAAVIEFLTGPLSTDPWRVGKALVGPLAGCHGARRGTYRVVYRIDEEEGTVHVLDVGHRSTVYRRR